MITSLSDSVLSLIFPSKCVVCSGGVESHADGPACASCWSATRLFDGTETLCEKCGGLLPTEGGPDFLTCGDCIGHYYEQATSLGIYEKALAAVVISLKSEPNLPARIRSEITSAFSRRPRGHLVDVIVPVPLSKKRYQERGFNQAAVVAQFVGSLLARPVDEHSVARLAHTPMHRGLMDRKAREASVNGAFEIVRPKLIAGKNVLLIDDVFTTGSTVSACAGALKEGGVSNVSVFTLARAVKRF